MEIHGEKIFTYVTEEDIQERAENMLDRRLTKDEMEGVENEILEHYWHIQEMLDETISAVISFNKLINRNKNAETKPVHYLVYWKNENAFQKEYTQVFAALTERDARKYIATDLLDEFVYFKITKVEKNTETEVEVIHNELMHSSQESAEF